MKLLPNNECCGCLACFNACPVGCISVKQTAEGFYVPDIEDSRCKSCGRCTAVCPVIKSRERKRCEDAVPSVFLLCNNDEDVRNSSSSGGAFSLLAEEIINRGGTVWGAALDLDRKTVSHIAVKDIDGLSLLRGSKYVESYIGSTYKDVKNDLETGDHPVLFSGTPCEVEGLISFLGRPYDDLYTVDFLCHGVPSQKLFSKYINYLEDKYSSRAARFSFRDKTRGWRDFSCRCTFSDGSEYRKPFESDPYGVAFVRNASLRSSCYACAFKMIDRVSDITIADAWGVENYCHEFFDDKGTSCVYVHRDKALKLLQDVSKNARLKQLEKGSLTKAMLHNAPKHPTRDAFYENIDRYDLEALVKRYAAPSLKKRIVYMLRRLHLLDAVKKIIH